MTTVSRQHLRMATSSDTSPLPSPSAAPNPVSPAAFMASFSVSGGVGPACSTLASRGPRPRPSAVSTTRNAMCQSAHAQRRRRDASRSSCRGLLLLSPFVFFFVAGPHTDDVRLMASRSSARRPRTPFSSWKRRITSRAKPVVDGVTTYTSSHVRRFRSTRFSTMPWLPRSPRNRPTCGGRSTSKSSSPAMVAARAASRQPPAAKAYPMA
mmetsp:Transcript_29284/g.93863  ORF Transcript_29284/g.93863 Transcript_29284/m.93863 type:complete len:210 (-) Transcript_29284:12-641(-)